MGAKVVEGYAGPGVVSERLITKVVRIDRPLDGGGDYEIDGMELSRIPDVEAAHFPAWREGDPAAAEAAANVAMVDSVISPVIADTARKAMAQGVSYAGETPPAPNRVPANFRSFPTMP